MAQAGATFATTLMRAAFKNEKGLRACSFVHLCADESGKTIQKELKSDISVFAATVKLDVRLTNTLSHELKCCSLVA